MNKILVTQRSDYIAKYNETRDALDQRWVSFFESCELVPIILPNNLEMAKKIVNTNKFEGIVLTGGNDSLQRNQLEKWLIDYSLQNSLPLIGVCHGMQAIQQYFELILDKVSGHVTDCMKIRILGEPALINSYHELGTQQTSKDLLVWARAYDNIVKAVYHRDHPILGIMWHPERYEVLSQADIYLFKNLFITKHHPVILIEAHKEASCGQ